jgi:hypothetical protein
MTRQEKTTIELNLFNCRNLRAKNGGACQILTKRSLEKITSATFYTLTVYYQRTVNLFSSRPENLCLFWLLISSFCILFKQRASL